MDFSSKFLFCCKRLLATAFVRIHKFKESSYLKPETGNEECVNRATMPIMPINVTSNVLTCSNPQVLNVMHLSLLAQLP